MNDKVKELVEWVAESYYKICSSCSSLNVAWAKLLDDERKPFKEAARQILSHPDLAIADKRLSICEGTKCPRLKDQVYDGCETFDCDDVEDCIYSDEFVKGWYNCQNQCGFRRVISLAKAIKEVDNEPG